MLRHRWVFVVFLYLCGGPIALVSAFYPLWTALAAVGMLMALGILARPILGLYLLLALFLLEGSPVYQSYGIFAPGATLADAVTAILLTGLLGRLALGGSRNLLSVLRGPAGLALLSAAGYGAWESLSTAWSPASSAQIDSYLRLSVESVLLLALCVLLLRTRREVRTAAAVYAVTGLGIAVFTIITYRNNLGFLHGVSPFDSRAWRGGLPGRFNSDQVAFSLALVPGFAFLACEGLRPHLKALATAATLPIVGLAFLIVASREGFVAGALGVLAAAVLARGHRRRMALALGVAFAGLLLLLALETGTVPSYVSQRLAQAQYDQLGGRLPLWRLGLDLFEQNPVAGLGAYGYQTVSPRYHVSVDGAPFIDNAYLRVLTDTGIVGLVLLLTLLALILYAAVFGGGRDPAVIVLATMILVFLNGADNLDMLWVWISLGVLYCFALTAKTAPISEPSGAFGRRQRHASLILSAASGAGDGGG